MPGQQHINITIIHTGTLSFNLNCNYNCFMKRMQGQNKRLEFVLLLVVLAFNKAKFVNKQTHGEKYNTSTTHIVTFLSQTKSLN